MVGKQCFGAKLNMKHSWSVKLFNTLSRKTCFHLQLFLHAFIIIKNFLSLPLPRDLSIYWQVLHRHKVSLLPRIIWLVSLTFSCRFAPLNVGKNNTSSSYSYMYVKDIKWARRNRKTLMLVFIMNIMMVHSIRFN